MKMFVGMRCKISPLILAVGFITCFDMVLGRHRMRYNRDRFKRQQGAHLYLPGSFVTDGGGGAPDAGPWSEWSGPSPCSRTCGGGVASQTRECTVGYECQGVTSRYFSCNTQDCPDQTDYREQQCSEYNTIPFEGIYYEWVPYTKAPNECELNCMPRGERFYFRHSTAVVDGTRCNEDSFNVCVNGTCQPVGCDRMLGSPAREDLCRVCGGDGSSCNTFENVVPMKDMQVGYNDILLIPAGATNIKVEEIGPSNNYLAVRNTSGHYYLNGNWRIDFPRSLEFAGCKFRYERYPQGFSAPDIITCLGPTYEPLFVVLLYQDEGVPVKYTYSLPTNVPPPSNETYAWTYDEFTPCSATCGGGYQFRNVTCAGRNSLEPVDQSLCDSTTEPEEKRRCNEVACEAQWVPYPWKQCSAPCGEGGVQTRDVFCQQIVSNGQPTLVNDSECEKTNAKPSLEQKCNVGKVCATWHKGPWKPCDHLCGDGKETRKVQCYIENEGKKQILEDSECEAVEPKPEEEKKCNLRPCEGVDWITSEWTGCERICGLKNETRKVHCAIANGTIFPDELCNEKKKPETVRECDTENATCEYLWYASQWSECSVQCGEGVQTRTLFCGVVTLEGVKKVENENCDQSKHFETLRNCTGEMKECEGEWFSGPWTECSLPCGFGERVRKVVCIKDNIVVDPSVCSASNIIFSQEECNTQPCSEDTIIPTDVTHPVVESEPTKESESEETTDSIQSDSSETKETDAFELTTEISKQSMKSQPKETPEDDDEYEIVPDTNCDDGEWVDIEDTEPHDEPLDTTIAETEGETKSPLTLDDLMLSDGTTVVEEGTSLDTGSGASELTSPSGVTDTSESTIGSTDFEGSGTDTTASDIFESESTFLSGSSPLSTDSSAVSFESTDSTVEGTSGSNSSDSASEASDVTTETGSSVSDTDISDSGISSIGSSESSDVTTETGGSSSDSSVSTVSLSEESESTDISETPATTSEESSTSDTTDTSGSTESSDITQSSVSTESPDTTISADTTETIVTDSSLSTDTGTTESTVSESTVGGTDTSDSTTESISGGTTEKDSYFVGESEDGKPLFGTPESETEFTGSTEQPESTTEYTGSTEESASTVELTGSTEVTSTASGLPSSSEFEETTVEFTGSTTEFTGSTTELTGSSTEFTGSTTEFTGSTTEFTGSTESPETTSEFTGSTESEGTTTEFTGTTESSETESDIFSSTPSGMTEESTELYATTSIMEIFTPTLRMCKRRKIKACKKTKHGCCWDNITPAEGPFDAGCPSPKTCKESKFGCCGDGVSAALGPKNAGCPPSHCNETLFGCCPDHKTQAEGNDDEGCPPKCLSSKYGCCDDNVTEATGPKHKGCEEEEIETTTAVVTEPEGSEETTLSSDVTTETAVTEDCNNTTFRCCPDGATAASGPGYQGCDIPCSKTPFNCCQDGKTPAHGPGGEGCCLSSPFGCCSDNVMPARGPNMEGCVCQSSPYGCCPDNKTSARGYNNEGCGCQYTEHGCCPDNFTPAPGPEFQGCLCHTFQFGCCPDGVTTAKGPHQQGCGCRNTEFGCCSDEETPSPGSNMQGCTCEGSKYGCCLDGVTEAKGDNFEECETAPQNLQAGCGIPKERGTCRNYTVKWFFDMDYGGCSRFWYGGCGGNANRYKTKEECEQICVEPQGGDICNLPKIAGPCEGYYPNWYYDKGQNHCAQFIYGGCLGNKNRFETREECSALCVKDSSVDACEQNKEEGPCSGQYQRFYYNKESDQCEPFVYGGCKGNNNNYRTIEACQQKCKAPGRKKDHCSLPRAQGNCTEPLPRWFYDTPEKRCLPFYYSGCNGNQNNFDTKEACERDCPMEIVKDTCQLAAETGECANYVEKWYYDTRAKACRQFYYGGCGGNGNNFDTEQLCQYRCTRKEEPEPVAQPESQRAQTTDQPEPAGEPFRTEMCFLPSETGPCRGSFIKFYYDSTDGVCKTFTYGGCQGNRNTFETADECLQHCGTAQDYCTLPPVVGPCDGEYLQYYYSPSADSCQPFNYGGCGGNYNRFPDQATCEQTCRRAPPATPATQAPPVPSDAAMCYEPSDPGNCTDNQVAYFFDRDSRRCTSFSYTGCGGNANRFNTEEQCERQCGTFRGQDTCNIEKDPGPCEEWVYKFYYDRNTGRCEQFIYGGCQGNGNRFSSKEECEHICVTHEESRPSITSAAVCQLPVDQGSCEGGYHKRWYFDDQRGECLVFIYSGCGGNFNNFKSFQSCLDFCRELMPKAQSPNQASMTDTPPHPCQGVFDECTTLRCAYGVEPYVDDNECNRCRCRDPCMNIECLEDEQCAIDINRNRTSNKDADFIAVCRKRVKPGICPDIEQSDNYCEEECRTDADCTLHLKCCSTGCGTSCVDPTPGQLITQQPEMAAFTSEPVEAVYHSPKVDPLVYEPEVSALIGDQATLRCAVSGNPNPRIRWKKDSLEIDGTQPRYRIKLDQALQIITLHKTDSGIYLCTADNGIGEPITNQIKLDVLDSDPRPATILDQHDEPPVIVSLNAPTTLNCFVLGYPFPAITWWKDDAMIPFKNNEFEVRKDYSLLIHSVKLKNLGIYTCQAYNGFGKAASWAVTVKARGPYHFTNPEDLKYRQYIVNPPEEPTTPASPTPVPPLPHRYSQRPPQRPTPQPYQPQYSFTEPSNEIQPEPALEGGHVSPSVFVPVRANITTSDQRYPVGADIDLPCAVIGFPTPQVQWYKDGVPINPDDRIEISGANTLSIRQATKADSGFYQCEATNAYSKATSTLQILIEGMYIHPSCTDNQFFANCALIVKAKICAHKYYAKFCCRSCTEAGLLPVDGPHLHSKHNALLTNLV